MIISTMPHGQRDELSKRVICLSYYCCCCCYCYYYYYYYAYISARSGITKLPQNTIALLLILLFIIIVLIIIIILIVLFSHGFWFYYYYYYYYSHWLSVHLWCRAVMSEGLTLYKCCKASTLASRLPWPIGTVSHIAFSLLEHLISRLDWF